MLIMWAIEIDRASLADAKMHTIGDLVDVDTNRDALSEAHPRKHRVHFRETLRFGAVLVSAIPRLMLSTCPSSLSPG